MAERMSTERLELCATFLIEFRWHIVFGAPKPLLGPIEIECLHHILTQLRFLKRFGLFHPTSVIIDCLHPSQRTQAILSLRLVPFNKPLPSILTTLTAYIDIEGASMNPSEVAIIIANGTQVMATFHHLCSPPNYDENLRWPSVFIHGISLSKLVHSVWSERDHQRMINFLASWHNPPIMAHGTDIAKFLATPSLTVNQVDLPDWNVRPAHFSHHVAALVKVKYILPTLPCHPRHHRVKDQTKIPSTLNQFNKQYYGFHCAFADVYELFLFHTCALRRPSDAYCFN